MLVIANETASPEHPTIPAILALVFSRNIAAKAAVSHCVGYRATQISTGQIAGTELHHQYEFYQ